MVDMRYLDAVKTGDKQWSKIGLGTWQFGSREWGYGDDYASHRSKQIVARALELGVTFFDTAEAYGFGRSERILGDALGDAITDVAVASKIFPVLPIAPVVQQRAVASARRLGVRTLDLYQVHQANPVIKDPSTMRGMADLQELGLVDHVGVSNYDLARWHAAERALGSPVISNQVQYSLVAREPDEGMNSWAGLNRRAVIAYSPLAQGFLSAKHTEQNRPTTGVRAMNPLFLPENLRRAQPLFAALREVADAHDVTPAQIALAWAIHRPHVLAIPGASSVEQLESNVAAADIELADDEYRTLTDRAREFTPVTGLSAKRSMAQQRVARLLRR